MESLPDLNPTISAIAKITKLKARITPVSRTALNVVMYFGRALILVVAFFVIAATVTPIYRMIVDSNARKRAEQRAREADMQRQKAAEERARQENEQQKALPPQLAQDRERVVQLQKDIRALKILTEDERLAGDIATAEAKFLNAKLEQDQLESDRKKALESQSQFEKDAANKSDEVKAADKARAEFEQSEAAVGILKKDAEVLQKLEASRSKLHETESKLSNIGRTLMLQEAEIMRAKRDTDQRFAELDSRKIARTRLMQDLLAQQQFEASQESRMDGLRKTQSSEEQLQTKTPGAVKDRVQSDSVVPPLPLPASSNPGTELPFAPNAIPGSSQPNNTIPGSPQAPPKSFNGQGFQPPSRSAANAVRTIPSESRGPIIQFIQLHLQYFEHMKDERMRLQMLADYAPISKFHGRQGFRRQDIEADRKDYKTFLVPHFTFEGVTDMHLEQLAPYGDIVVVAFRWRSQFNAHPPHDHIDTWGIAWIDNRFQIVSEASDND